MASESLLNQLKQPFYNKDGTPNERLDKYCSQNITEIIIDGNKFNGYKTYSFFWEKTYVKEPERSTSGTIGNLNSYPTFITPHLQIKYPLLSMEDYRRLYDLILSKNEFVVTCYDVIHNTTTTNKMYFYPDSLPKLNMMARNIFNNGVKEKWIELLGVQDYTIEMVGTNESFEIIDVLFYDENDKLIPEATIQVQNGVEFLVDYNYVAPNGKRFEGVWLTENDTEIPNGSAILATNALYADVSIDKKYIKLKAKVVSSDIYTLSLDYGKGLRPSVQNLNYQIDTFEIVQNANIVSTIEKKNIILSNGKEFDFPINGTGIGNVSYNGKEYEGTEVYTFKGWYWTNTPNELTKVDENTNYSYTTNRTIYQIYEPRTWGVTYNTNQDGITINATRYKYGEQVIAPQLNVSGKIFEGWFWVDAKDGKEYSFVSGTTMPPFDITIYAKWEDIKQ